MISVANLRDEVASDLIECGLGSYSYLAAVEIDVLDEMNGRPSLAFAVDGSSLDLAAFPVLLKEIVKVLFDLVASASLAFLAGAVRALAVEVVLRRVPLDAMVLDLGTDHRSLEVASASWAALP